jgi:hypothetical protein
VRCHRSHVGSGRWPAHSRPFAICADTHRARRSSSGDQLPIGPHLILVVLRIVILSVFAHWAAMIFAALRVHFRDTSIFFPTPPESASSLSPVLYFPDQIRNSLRLDENFAPRRLDRDQVEEKNEEISDFAALGNPIRLPTKTCSSAHVQAVWSRRGQLIQRGKADEIMEAYAKFRQPGEDAITVADV